MFRQKYKKNNNIDTIYQSFFLSLQEKTMNVKAINQLATAIAAANLEKGFTTPSLGTCLMLIVSELSEAVEAHRAGRRVDISLHHANLALPWDCFGTEETYFKEHIKDTVEDEIADAYIRVLDTLGRFKIQFQKCDPSDVSWYVEDVNSIPERILYLVKMTADTLSNSDVQLMLSLLLVEIRDFCSFFNISLDHHVKYKLMYNKTRPTKHGKAY